MQTTKTQTARSSGHLHCLYESEEELLSITVPFMTDGLVKNNKCVVVAGDLHLRAITKGLRDLGNIYCGMFRSMGRLKLCSELDGCPFALSTVNVAEPDKRQLPVSQALLDSGFEGYRSAIVVTDFICNVDPRSMIEREILLNRMLSQLPATLLLFYDRRALSEPDVNDMLKVHPRLIDRGILYENESYIWPEELL